MTDKSIEVWAGSDALAAIGRDSLRAAWLELYDGCAWATVCQHPDLIATHWRVHHDLYEPVLIVERDAAGRLTGLLALYRDGSQFRNGAGDDAEYNVWLTTPESAETFMPAALLALRAKFGSFGLDLDFIPPGCSLDWARTDPAVSGWCSLTPVVQRILRVQPGVDVLNAYRGKSRLKGKINKLNARGTLRFRAITEVDDFDRVLEQFMPLFDFRKGAMFGAFAFRGNSHRQRYLRELFKTPGLTNVAALELNGKLIAAHFGLEGKGGLYSLGGVAHDEFLAKCSPGTVIQMHLFQSAVERGHTILDLTPGDDTYKSHWANDERTAFKLCVRSSRLNLRLSAAKDKAKSLARAIVKRLTGHATGSQHHEAPPAESTTQMPLYRVLPADYDAPSADANWQTNSVTDLLKHPGSGAETRAFLRRMQRYIKDDATVFTKTRDGKLIDGWVMFKAADAVESTPAAGRPPADSQLLIGLGRYVSHGAAPANAYQSLHSLSNSLEPTATHSWLVVLPEIAPDSKPESLGFVATPWRVLLTTEGHIPRRMTVAPCEPAVQSPALLTV